MECKGPGGPAGEEADLNTETETEILNDTPSAGDTTVYKGFTENPVALTSAAEWKIFKTVICFLLVLLAIYPLSFKI